MRLSEKDIHTVARFKHATLELVELDDIWHAYNFIFPGDKITSKTCRKVHKEGATGMVQTQQKAMTLTLRIDKINYDTKAGSIRIGGQNVFGNEHVRAGAYHTLELRLQSKFRLEKDEWDSVALEQLQTATDPSTTSEVAAVLLDDDGNALVCLLTSALSVVRAQIDCNVPRKGHSVGSGRDQALEKFFVQVAQNIERHVNLQVVRCVIVASPGFVKDDFLKFFWTWCERNEKRAFLDTANRGKFIAMHSSSAKKHALSEILMDERMASKLADTKAALECRCLNQFFEQLVADARARTGLVQAVYGLAQVERAAELQAVSKLLVLDDLFRHASSVSLRKRYVALVDRVRRANPDRSDAALICSSQHTASERLRSIGGLAAILRYGLPESQFEDDEDEEITFVGANEDSAAAAASESAADGSDEVDEAGGQLDDFDADGEGEEEKVWRGGDRTVSSAAAELDQMDLDDETVSSTAPFHASTASHSDWQSAAPSQTPDPSSSNGAFRTTSLAAATPNPFPTSSSSSTASTPQKTQLPSPKAQPPAVAIAPQNNSSSETPSRAPAPLASSGAQSKDVTGRTSKPQPTPLSAKQATTKQQPPPTKPNAGGKRGGGGGGAKGKQRAQTRREDDDDFIEDDKYLEYDYY